MNDYAILIRHLSEAYRRRVEQLNAETAAILLTNLMTLAGSRKLYLFKRSEDLETLWSKIRQDDEMLHLLMHLTEDFLFRIQIDGLDPAVVIQNLATATAMLRGTSNDSAVDDDYFERSPSYEEILPIYQSNPWLVTLKLLLTLPAELLAVTAPKHG